jgi:hypothetical protein
MVGILLKILPHAIGKFFLLIPENFVFYAQVKLRILPESNNHRSANTKISRKQLKPRK